MFLVQYLEEEYRKGIREDDPMPPVQPYHYGSHYSNSGTVLHFLVRMPPFTKMFLAYQGESPNSIHLSQKKLDLHCFFTVNIVSTSPVKVD